MNTPNLKRKEKYNVLKKKKIQSNKKLKLEPMGWRMQNAEPPCPILPRTQLDQRPSVNKGRKLWDYEQATIKKKKKTTPGSTTSTPALKKEAEAGGFVYPAWVHIASSRPAED